MLRCLKCGEVIPVACPECDGISFTPRSIRRIVEALGPADLEFLLKAVLEKKERLVGTRKDSRRGK